MIRPQRLQLSRAKGFNLQEASRALNGLLAVKVSRPGLFGNPFVVGRDGDAAHCVALFRRMLESGPLPLPLPSREAQDLLRHRVRTLKDRLRGKNLACWCKPGAPCHADVLLELANA